MKLGISGVIGLAALLMAGCNNSTLAAFEKAAAELPAAEAAAKQLGLPLTGADLMPKTPVRPEDNAAPLILEAGKTYRLAGSQSRGWEQSLGQAFADPTPANLAKAQATLQPFNAALDQAVLAAAKPQVDFGHDWDSDEPWNLTFPEYSEGKNLVKGLSYRAQLRTRRGDTAGALSDLQAAAAMGRFMGSEPTLIGGLVRVAIDALVVRSMEYAITIRSGDMSFLQDLDALAAPHAAESVDLLHALRGEIVFNVTAAGAPAERLLPMASGSVDEADTAGLANQADWKRRLAPAGVPETVRTEAFRARALQPWVELYADPEVRKDPMALVRRMEDLDQRLSNDPDPTLAVHQILFPVLAGAGDALVTGRTRWQAVRGLMAVLRFKGAQGRYPATLAEAGFTDVDPFTGQAFHLKVEGETVRVYSVGPDGVDNGGEERVNTAPDAPRQMDIVSMFPRRVNAPPK